MAFDKTALTLVIIGAINWLLVGLFNFNLVEAIFGATSNGPSTFSRIIYVLVGLAGLWCITLLFKRWHHNREDK